MNYYIAVKSSEDFKKGSLFRAIDAELIKQIRPLTNRVYMFADIASYIIPYDDDKDPLVAYAKKLGKNTSNLNMWDMYNYIDYLHQQHVIKKIKEDEEEQEWI